MNIKKISFQKIRLQAFLVVLVVILSLLSVAFYVKAEDGSNSIVISENYLRGAKAGMSSSQLKKAYTSSMHGCEYDLYDVKGYYISTTNVGHRVSTGDYIQDSKGKKYTVIVTGDIDGDGRITITDTAAIKMHFAGTITLENELFQAANVEANNRINTTDYLRLKFYIQEVYDIYSNEFFTPDEMTSEDNSSVYGDESGWTSGWSD